ncbi:hypothetical protein BDD43_0254 [Mucilaginibacter gracilis]|uniref:Uncharacterized protein n=1 Tax=Mucilaginibacter gracilis TaxID=423350 RepID=A0A495IVY8_9SPHI|nr:hypothetical protein BDD43_0254 [Mucilaginibacter gracilis]
MGLITILKFYVKFLLAVKNTWQLNYKLAVTAIIYKTKNTNFPFTVVIKF